MSISIVTGAGALTQLGLSISDIALFVQQGKKLGNFLRVKYNNADLFDILGENPEDILRRRGVILALDMEKKWPKINFIHRGTKVMGRFRVERKNATTERNNRRGRDSDQLQSADAFTWVMAGIVSALDDCLPSYELQEFLIQVFVTVLDGDEHTVEALRIHFGVNIESWRSFGCARDFSLFIKREMRKSLSKHLNVPSGEIAVLQMNDAEMKEMLRFLVWLLEGNEEKNGQWFNALSAITFAVAEALRSANFDLCTDGNPRNGVQACVTYQNSSSIFREGQPQGQPTSRGLNSRTLQIAWPRDKPQTMIDTLPVNRHTINSMEKFWEYGSRAAEGQTLRGRADLPYEDTQEIFYEIYVERKDSIQKKFSPHIGMMAEHGFPKDTQTVFEGLEKLTEGQPHETSTMLHKYSSHDFLLRNERLRSIPEKENMDIFLNYQALIFGFYYRLLKPLLCFDLVEEGAFFHGIWGPGSTTFLAMCTQFSNCLRRDSRVSRAHVLYMLAAMYNGSRRVFNADMSTPRLVGILGSISVLALPLIRTTDEPREIERFTIVDIPIVDLLPDTKEGDLMAGEGGGISFRPAPDEERAVTSIQLDSPRKKWTVHPAMNVLFGGEQTSGVVMAARCGGRLVGWFNPLAADIQFLSEAYVGKGRSEPESFSLDGFVVKDEDWQRGCVQRPVKGFEGRQFGIVHSQGSLELRYAAAGFFAGNGEEVAIVKSGDLFHFVCERVEERDEGIIIA